MKVSVAMCTYNGAKFVREQLDSIARQSRKPDELIVVDDRSTDATVEIVREFAKSAPFPVFVHVNPENIGSTANFSKATSLCKGDLIFWSDQDDYWHEIKIEKAIESIVRFPSVGAVICNSNAVSADLTSKGHTQWETLHFDSASILDFNNGDAFNIILRRNVATGMTMAFKSEYLNFILPIPGKWFHDAWAALLISAVSPMYAIDEVLVDYRQHGAQIVGSHLRKTFLQKASYFYNRWKLSNLELFDRFTSIADRLELALDRLNAFYPDNLLSPQKARIAESIIHFRARAKMRKSGLKRYYLILGELRSNRYRTCSSGYRSVVEDLFF